jgi:hypothetical protein
MPPQPLLVLVLVLVPWASAATAAEGGCGAHTAVLQVGDFLARGSSLPPRQLQASLQAAIDAAVARARTQPTTLQLENRREYRLASPNASAHSPVLCIVNASGGCPLHIDGRGAAVVVTTPMAGLFSIQNASNLRVSNLSVDYDPLPMTQGRVTAVHSPTSYTIQLAEGFPSLMSPQFTATLGYARLVCACEPSYHPRHVLLTGTGGHCARSGGWGVGGAAWAIVKDPARPTVHKNGTLNLIRVAGWQDRGNGGRLPLLPSTASSESGSHPHIPHTWRTGDCRSVPRLAPAVQQLHHLQRMPVN